jgi:hypothetical protein
MLMSAFCQQVVWMMRMETERKAKVPGNDGPKHELKIQSLIIEGFNRH